MKTVIEKIILTYFGTFINGIHKDKLSIDLFGGNFQLENISLNQQYFDGLNTPFKLTYSSIGKLNLQVPLSPNNLGPALEAVLSPRRVHPRQHLRRVRIQIRRRGEGRTDSRTTVQDS